MSVRVVIAALSFVALGAVALSVPAMVSDTTVLNAAGASTEPAQWAQLTPIVGRA